VYLNVQKLANAAAVVFPGEMLLQVRELNTKKSLHYDEVLAIKNKAIKILYENDKLQFKDDFGWFSFLI
jgi:hypothetical protein